MSIILRVLRPEKSGLISFRRVIPALLGEKRILIEKRYFASENKEVAPSAKVESQVSTSVVETVKEATKTASYLTVIVIGIGVTALMFYAISSELMSSKSPNSVYKIASERCSKDPKVLDALGEPVKSHGEETRRRRRRHVSHVLYQKDGVEHMRMQFYVQGSRERGVVQLEMKEDSNGKYQYRYMFLQLESSGRVIILEDNRALESPTALTPLDKIDLSQSLAYQ